MESRWPEHTPEPDEPPPWRGWVMGAAAIAAVVFLLPRENNWFGSWQAPNFAMPEINIPEISMPEIDLRGLSGGDQPETTSPITASVSEAVPGLADAPHEDGQPIVQQMPLDSCVSTIEQLTTAMGAPGLIEDTPQRRVVRFKLLEGNLTVTCAAGAMTLEQTT